MQNVRIRLYKTNDSIMLFHLLSRHDDWREYTEAWTSYTRVLRCSKTLILFEKEMVIGFLRYKIDGAFGVYIFDLLVDKEYRGRGYGKALIAYLAKKYSSQIIYVMSDADAYYENNGFEKVGSILQFKHK